MTLRRAGAGADALVTGQALTILYDSWFRIGQSFMPAMNDLLLGYLLYKSRLVPRVLSLIGLVGVPLLVASATSAIFGLIQPLSPLSAIATFPIALFEFALGVWLIVKGFNKSAITTLFEKTTTN